MLQLALLALLASSPEANPATTPTPLPEASVTFLAPTGTETGTNLRISWYSEPWSKVAPPDEILLEYSADGTTESRPATEVPSEARPTKEHPASLNRLLSERLKGTYVRIAVKHHVGKAPPFVFYTEWLLVK